MSQFCLQDPRHEAVRQELLARYGTSNADCGVFTREMQRRFPELTRVPGFYYPPDSEWSHGEHWWLEDAQGRVIDPTADQWPSCGKGRYVRYDPHVHRVVKGKCMNCGVGLFSREGHYACSPSCADDLFEAYHWRTHGPYESEMEFSCDAELSQKYGLTFANPLPA